MINIGAAPLFSFPFLRTSLIKVCSCYSMPPNSTVYAMMYLQWAHDRRYNLRALFVTAFRASLHRILFETFFSMRETALERILDASLYEFHRDCIRARVITKMTFDH